MSRRSRRKRRRKNKNPLAGHRSFISIKKTYTQNHGDEKKETDKKSCRGKINYEN